MSSHAYPHLIIIQMGLILIKSNPYSIKKNHKHKIKIFTLLLIFYCDTLLYLLYVGDGGFN